jgi:DNA-binding transcriptional LysR family regulator
MLNLRFVETLREVAAHGSFSGAAQALRYTQPAVSRQVALLEREVGMPLVVRSRRGAHLTAAGKLVVEHADALRARLRRLDAELAELQSGARVSVSLGGFPTAFVGLIPRIVKQLLARDPQAQIALRRCGHDEAIAQVRKAELDLALIFAHADVELPKDDLEVVELDDEPMFALLAYDHPAAAADTLALETLQDEPWIVGAPDQNSAVILTACRQAGFEPRIAYETDDALAIQSLVAAGLGVSLTTPWLATALRRDVVLRPLADPTPSRRVQAVLAKPAGPGARLLLDLAQRVGEHTEHTPQPRSGTEPASISSDSKTTTPPSSSANSRGVK